ncbi:MAG TPA: LCP family protein [Candidatus Limnocylindria bacterium]
MLRRDRSRNHATPTERARRIREAERRDRELRERGIDPDEYERQRAAIRSGRASDVRARASRAATAGTNGSPALAGERRGPSLRAVLLSALTLLLAVVLIGGVLLWGRVSAFNDSVSTSAAMSSKLFGPLGGKDRVNVVLLGYGGPEHGGGAYLADSIQILSIDPSTDTTTMIPIPRDFWIEGLPEIPNNGKINEVFAIGHQLGGIEEGAQLMTEVLSNVTGLEIQHWMAIDFAGFRDMVDAVGGVTVENPTAFSYTWDEAKFHAGTWDGGSFEVGTLHLNGTQALDYSRVRYASVPEEASDFARSVRQQRVLSALRSKLGAGGLGSLGPGLAMMDALKGRMRTDLSAFDLFLLSGHLNPDRRIELGEGVILEATSNTIGQYILVVIGRADGTDYQPLRDYLASELAQPIPSASPATSSVQP